MCSVSFVPRRQGFDLLMNRDELLDRPLALPPVRHVHGNRLALHPSEPSGGTWVAVHDSGVVLALVNWNRPGTRRRTGDLSRGTVIPALLTAARTTDMRRRLARLPLHRFPPFRLLIFSEADRQVTEFSIARRWAAPRVHPWQTGFWFSSGFDEAGAEKIRRATCAAAATEPGAYSREWLWRLHASHLPEPGPYSLCVHRTDAATVSATEVLVRPHRAEMRYHGGSPCQPAAEVVRRLPLRR